MVANQYRTIKEESHSGGTRREEGYSGSEKRRKYALNFSKQICYSCPYKIGTSNLLLVSHLTVTSRLLKILVC